MNLDIKLSTCSVRSWRPGDEPSLVRHANNPNVSNSLRDDFPSPYLMPDARRWIHLATTELAETAFAVDIAGFAVGGVGFSLGSDVYRVRAEIGYWLGEEFWGRGVMTEVVTNMSEWAFAEYQVHRVFAAVFSNNTGSMRVLEKSGFYHEGVHRAAVFKRGRFLDEVMYARLKGDSVD